MPPIAWIVAGLGNPGRRYSKSRHNIGFMVLDELARRAAVEFRSERSEAESATWQRRGRPAVLLVKPQSFMNLSGQPLGELARYYRVPGEQVLVVHDEMDLPLGRLQLRAGGGAAGHNGVRSCLEHLGPGFLRARVGIGKPPDRRIEGADFVLGLFAADERELLAQVIELVADAATVVLDEGLVAAQNRFHRRDLAAPAAPGRAAEDDPARAAPGPKPHR